MRTWPGVDVTLSKSLHQRPFLQTVSKAWEKSTNAQNKCFFLLLIISIKELKTKMWSDVLYSFRKPAWFSFSNL